MQKEKDLKIITLSDNSREPFEKDKEKDKEKQPIKMNKIFYHKKSNNYNFNILNTYPSDNSAENLTKHSNKNNFDINNSNKYFFPNNSNYNYNNYNNIIRNTEENIATQGISKCKNNSNHNTELIGNYGSYNNDIVSDNQNINNSNNICIKQSINKPLCNPELKNFILNSNNNINNSNKILITESEMIKNFGIPINNDIKRRNKANITNSYCNIYNMYSKNSKKLNLTLNKNVNLNSFNNLTTSGNYSNINHTLNNTNYYTNCTSNIVHTSNNLIRNKSNNHSVEKNKTLKKTNHSNDKKPKKSVDKDDLGKKALQEKMFEKCKIFYL